MNPMIIYITVIFLMQALSVIWDSATYITLAIFGMGLIAVIMQKYVHKKRIRDMGFTFDKKALVGLIIALVYTLYVIFVHYVIPWFFGVVNYLPNTESTIGMAFVVLVAGSIILGGAALFGEELAFRGYILNKLSKKFKPWHAILLNAVIFSLWHFPLYFSLYAGNQIWTIADNLLIHAITVIPICLLYMYCKNLYGISLFHGIVDSIQYTVIANTAFGEVAKDALLIPAIAHPMTYAVMNWGFYLISIPVMIGLIAIAKKKQIQ